MWIEMRKSIGQILCEVWSNVCLLTNRSLMGLSFISLVWMSMRSLHFFIFSRIDVEFEEFQTIMQHLPPSVLYVVIKSSENRSTECESSFALSSWSLEWCQKYVNHLDDLVILEHSLHSSPPQPSKKASCFSSSPTSRATTTTFLLFPHWTAELHHHQLPRLLRVSPRAAAAARLLPRSSPFPRFP